MNIIIGKPLKKATPKDKYKIVVHFMYGDADGSGKEKLLVSPDNPYIERFLNFLDRCDKAYPSGRGGYDEYSHVQDYLLFCGEEGDENEFLEGCPEGTTKEFEQWIDSVYDMIEKPEIKELRFDWQSDQNYITASYESYSITYFNHEGVEHDVKIKK